MVNISKENIKHINMEYYGQFELDRFIHEKYFLNKENGFFVECGAFDGITESSCYFFEKYKKWSGINIEVVKYAYDLLCVNRKNSINLNYALSNSEEVLPFENVIHPTLGCHFGNGSLNLNKQHKNDLLNQGCTIENLNVQCVRFSKIVKDFHITNIDLFVLDIEGHEPTVLTDMIENMEVDTLPKVFCIEYPLATLELITDILKDHYNFDCLYQNNVFFIKK